ncbi:MAG TPA: lipocalin-like domain-containing protein [Mycobacterium sp.]|nr:lipocalin-like domain-containing protein [Mycobacterium sp.]
MTKQESARTSTRKGSDPMTVIAAQDLRTSLVGAWTLESYESRSLDDSSVIYPLGSDAQGIIIYTADGYMSAQLMRSQRTPVHSDDLHLAPEGELAAAASGYLAYSGPYTIVNDALVTHHVVVSLLPSWIGGAQYRVAHLHDSRLELSLAEPALIHGERRNATLIWRRA